MFTIFSTKLDINELSVVCNGIYSTFVAISDNFLTVDSGSERRSIVNTDSVLLESLVLLPLQVQEKIIANIEVREVFKITNVGTVAGCMVLDGKIHRNSNIRVIRDGIVVYTGYLGSLKRFKDDVKEVSSGYECGLNVDKFNDIKVGDIIEAFETIETARKLD